MWKPLQVLVCEMRVVHVQVAFSKDATKMRRNSGARCDFHFHLHVRGSSVDSPVYASCQSCCDFFLINMQNILHVWKVCVRFDVRSWYLHVLV